MWQCRLISRLVCVWQYTKANVSCNLIKIEKTELRSVIKYLHLKGFTPTEIKAELDWILLEFILGFQWWQTGLPNLNVVTNSKPRNGRPRAAIVPNMTEKVHHIMLDDSRVKVRIIADIVGISNDKRVHRILTEELQTKK